ncbi:MAG: LicD family protein [Oscillospiraceae bacterium]|nr:LicD family protein [Oscillospiraceae bacterium]
MKEYERLIVKGLLPPDYLKEETICDFRVTEGRKKLWAVILDLIYEFDRVCQKHGLTYYMIYGSLLGAARHKGFIPWDDDFDVAMPRADYERFIRLSEEFQHPYFLQTPYTDPESAYSYAKIRNSNTTGISKMFQYSNFNHGIWITVFPLDYWDDQGGEERYAQIRQLNIYNSTFMRLKNPHLNEANQRRVSAYLAEHRDHFKDYNEIHRLASSCNDPNSKYVMTAVITMGRYDQKLLDAADFASAVSLPFEGLQVSAPCGWDHLLRLWYGDYMQFPPVEQRGMEHDGTIFDADIPYKEYLANENIHFD